MQADEPRFVGLARARLPLLFPVVQSLLASAISWWQKPIPDAESVSRLAYSIRIIRLLRATSWIPSPLCHADDLLLLASDEADSCSLLMELWTSLRDPQLHPDAASSSTHHPTALKLVRAHPTKLGSSACKFVDLLRLNAES